MYDFKGKFAVVTGAAQGIGAAVVQRFLTDGMEGVAMLDMNFEGVQKTAAEFDPSGKRTLPLKCDVSNLSEVEEVFKKIYEKFGRIDILVNNAGIIRDAMFHNMTMENYKLVIDVHLFGTVYCTKQVINGMREQKYGKIVSLASTSIYGNPGQTNYSAAKSAIVGFTKSLSKEVGRKNITVNCIAPGFINTDFIKSVPEEIMQASIKAHPRGRLGEPSEVAGLIGFLSSDDSSYVSGECIDIWGG